jgi:hypothetical protein
MMQWLREWLGRHFYPYSVSTDPILLYYLSTIDVRTRWLQVRQDELPPGSKSLLDETIKRRDEIEASPPGTFTDAAAWTEVYRLDRMMALLEPAQNLTNEIKLRLDEASAERVSAEPRLRAAFAAMSSGSSDTDKQPRALTTSEASALRGLLLEILEEIHWSSQRKFHSRPIQKAATRRIVWAGVFSFVLFILPYILIYINLYLNPVAADGSVQHGVPPELLIGLPVYTALTAGLFGSYFSRLLFIQKYSTGMSVGELKTAREFTSIFLRGVVGMCGALVVFFFLRSGIVHGKLFPEFDQLSVLEGQVIVLVPSEEGGKSASIRQILPSPNLALLGIWCFLAGFSERLVPSILSTTEKTLEDAAKGTKK